MPERGEIILDGVAQIADAAARILGRDGITTRTVQYWMADPHRPLPATVEAYGMRMRPVIRLDVLEGWLMERPSRSHELAEHVCETLVGADFRALLKLSMEADIVRGPIPLEVTQEITSEELASVDRLERANVIAVDGEEVSVLVRVSIERRRK